VRLWLTPKPDPDFAAKCRDVCGVYRSAIDDAATTQTMSISATGSVAPGAHVLLLLVSDVFADRLLVAPHRGDVKSPGPKVLPYEVALSLAIDPSQVDRALSLNVANHLRHRIFRRNRDHHVQVVGHQMTLLNPTFPLRSQPAEYLSKVPAQLPIQRLPSALGK
jgi:hypothetical protein